MRSLLPLLAGGAALALSACGSSATPDDSATTTETVAATATTPDAVASPEAAADGAPAAFAQCKVCHSTEKGTNMVGPSLAGIYGTKAGEVPGYTFSTAMIESGKVWDDATLDAYLTAPMKEVPGTKMAFAGIADPAKRKEVIEYLKTLK